MATPLFFVNLAEDARDYRHTALEPGLPLLDRQGVNFLILRKWLGDYVAEPEWRNESVVAFYMAEDERGRLENTDCSTVSKAELEKQFAPDLDAIRSKIKKAKAESSTESMVLRILKKTIAEQTNDLENSDFDSYFFKCRAADEPWRLVWCCGFQRADLEPLRGRIWHTPDGDFLGVRPPDGGRVKRRKRKGPLAILMHPAVWLLLLLLLGGFAYATWPTLVVTPADSTVPVGSRITYKVEDHRWYFFKNDVTSRVVAQSTDQRVVEFDPHGAVANAKSEGRAAITFLAGNRAAQAMVDVTPLTPPDSLVIEPADKVKLALGSTKQLKAIGRYNDGRSVDLTTQVDWWEEGEKRLLAMHDTKKGMVEATSAGATNVVARYPVPIDKAKDTYAETSIAVDVTQAKYKSLEVALDPFKFRVNESSRIEVLGIDENGEKHSLTGSSLLKFKVDPTTVASVDEGYLVGHDEEKGTLKVAYADLDKAVAFTVKGRLKIKFDVQPTESEAIPYELVPLNVTVGNNDPIEAQSSDPTVVEVFSTTTENAGFEVFLAARDIGEADITVSQLGESKTVKVTVVEGLIKFLEFAPPVMIMDVGHPEFANLRGTTEDGRVIRVVPDVLRWEKQPLVENVSLDQRTLLMRPLLATTFPQDLQVRLADTSLVAGGTVEVRGRMDVATIGGLTDVENWGVHPPVARRGRHIDLLGDVIYDSDAGGLVLDRVADGSLLADYQGRTLTGWNGRDFSEMTEAEMADYLRLHPPVEGDLIKYVGSDGLEHTAFLGGARAIRDFKLLEINTLNVAEDGLNAEVQAYLRLADDYRLVDKDGKALSDWKDYPADATPVMVSTTKIPRNASEDYELYVERKDGKRFQVTFRLGSESSTVIERAPRRVIEREGDVLDRAIGIPESTLKKSSSTTTRIRETVREVPRDVQTTSTTTIRDRVTTGPGGSGTRSSSTTVSSSTPAGSGSGTRSPSATSPASAPASPSAAPKTPPAKPSPSKPDNAPAKPDNAPAKPDNAPAKPDDSPAKPDPAKPDSAPPKPSPAKPSPAKPSPAKPSPAKPSPDDAQPSPDDEEEPEEDSDMASPDNVAPATPTGSGTRGTPTEPDAYGSGTRRPFGSATRAGANVPAGSATRGTSGLVRRAPERNPKKSSEDGEDKKGAKTLEALMKYNRDWQADKPK